MRSGSQCALIVMFALAGSGFVRAHARECVVKHHAFVRGGVANGQMRVASNGNGCSFTFKFGGAFEPSDWKIDEAPKHGRVEVGGSSMKYVPEDRYSGPDAFTVTVFGFNPMLGHGRRARNGQFAFKVDVSDAP